MMEPRGRTRERAARRRRRDGLLPTRDRKGASGGPAEEEPQVSRETAPAHYYIDAINNVLVDVLVLVIAIKVKKEQRNNPAFSLTTLRYIVAGIFHHNNHQVVVSTQNSEH